MATTRKGVILADYMKNSPIRTTTLEMSPLLKLIHENNIALRRSKAASKMEDYKSEPLHTTSLFCKSYKSVLKRPAQD